MDGMLICEYLWSAFFVIWIIWAIRTKKTQSRENVGSRLSYVVFAVIAFLMMFQPAASRRWLGLQILPNWPWLEALGVALTAAGLGFAVWARAYLGANWSSSVTVKVEHELIQTGPYRWVRHPIYTGMILAMLGTGIARAQVRGVIACIFLYISFYIKSGIEERTMRQTFGEQYDEYSKHTGRIVPRISL
jgi:protein-S-isoprenylcysteine O-methyltransferase Ste14